MIDKEIIVFGGGCFWCTEAVFSKLKGVKSVNPGYAGGIKENPTYEQVCSGDTGHAEVIKIKYDPNEIKLDDLLAVFFAAHNPITLNQQGNDIGTQYRSIIFSTTEKQKEEAEKFIKDLNDNTSAKIVTEVKPLEKFYQAEDYHRDYYKRNKSAPYCQIVINPKIDKLKDRFQSLLK